MPVGDAYGIRFRGILKRYKRRLTAQLQRGDIIQSGTLGLRESYEKPFLTEKKLIIGFTIFTVCASALGLGLRLWLDFYYYNNNTSNGGACLPFPGINEAHRSMQDNTGELWLQHECSFNQQPVCDQSFQDNPPLILISLDGFRAEYLHRNLTPVIHKLSDCGVKVPYMRPAFPTKTFPNHYTIATGLYPESHGIISIFMYDSIIKENFFTSRKDNRWWFGEPIWNTAMRAGKRVHAFFWPGTEVAIQGMTPDICYVFDEKVPLEDRVDTVLTWLDLDPSERPHLITLYFNELDIDGHATGPFSSDVEESLVGIDGVIGRLMDGLVTRQLDKCVNVLLMGDHGITEVSNERVVDLRPKLDEHQLFVSDGPVGRVTSRYKYHDDGHIEEVENPEPIESIMTRLKCGGYNTTADWYMRALRKEDLPKRLHHARSDRIEDIILISEDKWQVASGRHMDFFITEEGNHGFDNIVENMQAFFTGYGPSLKANFTAEPFENIELYNLMTQLLKIEDYMADNNGTVGSLSHLLSDSGSQFPTYPPPAGHYDSCDFPNEEEAEWRRNHSDCSSTNLQNLTSTPLAQLDKQLNLSDMEITVSEERHLVPLGKPGLDLTDSTLCQLTQTDYISGYSHSHHMPLWTAYTIQPSRNISNPVYEDTSKVCPRPDVRLPPEGAAKYSDYIDAKQNLSHAFLYPPSFTMTLSNETDQLLEAYISSNIVPMYQQFRKGVWLEVMTLAEEYSRKYGHIQVISGPVFDYNADGLGDSMQEITRFVGEGPVPIPSHFFIILARCSNSGNLYTCENDLDTMSIVIPHKPVLPNCWSHQRQGTFRYIQDNVVRMRDVELLTRLRLAEHLSGSTRVRLLTYLSIGLWDRMSWADSFSTNEECPDLQQAQCPSGYDADHPPVILISLAGFRPDYLDHNVSPTLSTLRRCGVSAPYMKSVFPTLTFPNHYSTVTGLYPESHGIVANSMFDLGLNESFFPGSPTVMNPKWWGGEPIWNTVEKAGKHAMTMMWIGADVPIQDIRITDSYGYNRDVPHRLCVDKVLDWLGGSAGVMPSLITLYFSSIDTAEHDGGYQSPQVMEAIKDVDKHLKAMMDGLNRMGLDKCVNVIITSNHGISDTSHDRNAILKEYLGDEIMDRICLYNGPLGHISNKYTCEFFNYVPVPEDQKVSPDEMVHKMSCRIPEMTVYSAPEMPIRLHHHNNPRIEEVYMLPRRAWTGQTDELYCGFPANRGRDPSYNSINGYFSGYGPTLKSKTAVEPFDSIELYNILAHMLDVPPAPNNGTDGSLYHILRESPADIPDRGASQDYLPCHFPQTVQEYAERANDTDCKCDISALTLQEVQKYDARLDMTESDRTALRKKHLPYGLPFFHNSTMCVLHHQDYVSGYDLQLHVPRWTAFTLTSDQFKDNLADIECVRPDVRVESDQQPRCSDFQMDRDYIHNYLFPLAMRSSDDSTMDGLLLTNSIAMLPGFATGVWEPVVSLLETWAAFTLHVISGPVFDYNADGLCDSDDDILARHENRNMSVVIPSHFYIAMMRCPTDDCSNMHYDIQAFVLPHRTNITNCMDFEEYLFDNRVRLKDIEILTGLEFLTASKDPQGARTRTSLPLTLWDKS